MFNTKEINLHRDGQNDHHCQGWTKGKQTNTGVNNDQGRLFPQAFATFLVETEEVFNLLRAYLDTGGRK